MGTRKQQTDLDFQNTARVLNLPVPTDTDEAATKDYVDTAVAGASGINWLGTWSSGTAYVLNDAVTYNGTSYISILAGTNHNPASSPTYWDVLALKGTNGTNGSNGTNGTDGQDFLSGSGVPSGGTGVNGDTYLNVTNGDVYAKSGGSWSLTGNLKGPTGATGALVDRDTATTTSSSIANGVNWQGTITLAKGYRLMRIETDYAARVRIYGTSAKQAADVSRPLGTDPTGDHGLLFEYVTTVSVLQAYLSPLVDGASFESTPSTTIPITVTNLSGSTHSIQVDLDFMITE